MADCLITLPGLYGEELTQKVTIPDGDQGTARTLVIMEDLARMAATETAWFSRIVRRVGAAAVPGFAYSFLRQHIPFRRDPGVESLTHPMVHLRRLANSTANPRTSEGDCDDVATFGAALLFAAGYTPCLIVTAPRPGQLFRHVFFGVAERGEDPTGVTPIDPQPGTPFGTWPDRDRVGIQVFRPRS